MEETLLFAVGVCFGFSEEKRKTRLCSNINATKCNRPIF